MAWTYGEDPAGDPIDAVRFLAGDTQPTDQLVQDEEVEFALATNGDNVYFAAADVCEGLASRFARSVSLSVEGLSAQFSDRSRRFSERAVELRKMARSRKQGRTRVLIDKQFGEGGRPPAFDVGMHDKPGTPHFGTSERTTEYVNDDLLGRGGR